MTSSIGESTPALHALFTLARSIDEVDGWIALDCDGKPVAKRDCESMDVALSVRVFEAVQRIFTDVREEMFLNRERSVIGDVEAPLFLATLKVMRAVRHNAFFYITFTGKGTGKRKKIPEGDLISKGYALLADSINKMNANDAVEVLALLQGGDEELISIINDGEREAGRAGADALALSLEEQIVLRSFELLLTDTIDSVSGDSFLRSSSHQAIEGIKPVMKRVVSSMIEQCDSSDNEQGCHKVIEFFLCNPKGLMNYLFFQIDDVEHVKKICEKVVDDIEDNTFFDDLARYISREMNDIEDLQWNDERDASVELRIKGYRDFLAVVEIMVDTELLGYDDIDSLLIDQCGSEKEQGFIALCKNILYCAAYGSDIPNFLLVTKIFAVMGEEWVTELFGKQLAGYSVIGQLVKAMNQLGKDEVFCHEALRALFAVLFHCDYCEAAQKYFLKEGLLSANTQNGSHEKAFETRVNLYLLENIESNGRLALFFSDNNEAHLFTLFILTLEEMNYSQKAISYLDFFLKGLDLVDAEAMLTKNVEICGEMKSYFGLLFETIGRNPTPHTVEAARSILEKASPDILKKSVFGGGPELMSSLLMGITRSLRGPSIGFPSEVYELLKYCVMRNREILHMKCIAGDSLIHIVCRVGRKEQIEDFFKNFAGELTREFSGDRNSTIVWRAVLEDLFDDRRAMLYEIIPQMSGIVPPLELSRVVPFEIDAIHYERTRELMQPLPALPRKITLKYLKEICSQVKGYDESPGEDSEGKDEPSLHMLVNSVIANFRKERVEGAFSYAPLKDDDLQYLLHIIALVDREVSSVEGDKVDRERVRMIVEELEGISRTCSIGRSEGVRTLYHQLSGRRRSTHESKTLESAVLMMIQDFRENAFGYAFQRLIEAIPFLESNAHVEYHFRRRFGVELGLEVRTMPIDHLFEESFRRYVTSVERLFMKAFNVYYRPSSMMSYILERRTLQEKQMAHKSEYAIEQKFRDFILNEKNALIRLGENSSSDADADDLKIKFLERIHDDNGKITDEGLLKLLSFCSVLKVKGDFALQQKKRAETNERKSRSGALVPAGNKVG